MNWILLAVGGFVLYEYLTHSSVPASSTTSTDPSASTTPSGGTAAAGSTTKTLVAAKAAQAGYGPGSLLNWDQWNYFFTQARGVPGPSYPADFYNGRDSQYKMTIDEWWAGYSSLGLSGLGNYAIAPGFANQRRSY